MATKVKSYCSTTLVLLAFDWPEGKNREDFLGFGIQRTPGFFEQPKSWLPNRIDFDGPDPIHHKFVLIDAETENPILYSGSANLSNNSLYNNDENLLEFIGSRQLANAYLAEFLRLYEHYRARLSFERFHAGQHETFKLTPNSKWAKMYYRVGSPEYKARRAMAGSD